MGGKAKTKDAEQDRNPKSNILACLRRSAKFKRLQSKNLSVRYR